MMRSMYSGVSGLRAHQLKMDIIGNNIANVNTVGFKGQRVTFQEVFNQTIRGAGSPQGGKGGTNPQQVGLGVSLSAIDTFHVRGAVQRTDNNTDLAINGDGFFILSDSAGFQNRNYTRSGNFSLDESGNLVASNGQRVLGYMADPKTGVMNTTLEGIRISKAQSDDAVSTSFVNFEGNLNNALPKITNIADQISFSSTAADGARLTIDPDKKWETTSVVYDALGGKHTLKFTFVRGLANDGGNNLTLAADETNWVMFIEDIEKKTMFQAGNPNEAVSPLGLAPTVGGENLAKVGIPVKFSPEGKLLVGGTNTTGQHALLNLQVAGSGGAAPFPVSVDIRQLTQFHNDSTASITKKDGYPQGFLDTFSIGPTGEINGVFTNGQNRVIGRVAMAVFKNPAGLEKTTENMYIPSPNSGEPIYGVPGSSGMGSLNPGTLEMSNVDLSREFTEMISTQRGFQANSRIITSSDEMLQELVNLKR